MSRLFDAAVVISPFYWNFREDMLQTTHYVARALAQRCPTVLVEPPVQWNPRAEWFAMHRLPSALFSQRVRTPMHQLSVVHRRGLPFARLRWIRNFDLARNAKALKHLLSTRGFRRPLLWHSFPYWSLPLVEAVAPVVFAYQCIDYSSQTDEEAYLIRRADAVFAVSDVLVERLRSLNSNIHLLPNGVDLELFNVQDPRNHQRPSDLPAGRLLGFIGLINHHVDVEVLLRLARAFHRDHLVLIGRLMTHDTAPRGAQAAALRTLLAMPNVRHLGFKPPHQLPRYLHAFDVCLMPFLDDAFNRDRDPLKFYQYLAMGKPVVTTPVSAAVRYGHVCYVVPSRNDFIAAVDNALAEPARADRSGERIAVAQTHSWTAIVNNACAILQATR